MIRALGKYTFALLGLAWILTSCEPVEGQRVKPAPEDLIPQETMTQMLIDMHLIEGARSGTRVLGDSASVDAYYDGLWRKYDVTQEQYDSSFRYYTQHPVEMMEMYDIVIDSLRLREIKITEQARSFRPSSNANREESDISQEEEE